MKNIPAFAVLVIILSALAAKTAVHGQAGENGNAYVFSLAPQFGVLYGQAREIVYPTDTKGEYLSRLLWDMKPLFYSGAALNVSPQHSAKSAGGFFAFSCKFGFPGETGTLEDRDWQSTENANLTDFSSHSNKTEKFLWVESAGGISIPMESFLRVRFFAAFSYMRMEFSGHDGSGTYARENPANSGKYDSIDNNPITEDFNGREVITYTQEWLIVSPGLSFEVDFWKYFSFDFSFRMSPLIFCNDRDEHLTTGDVFTDFTRGGLFLEPRAALTFNANRHVALSLEGGYRCVSDSVGDTYNTNGFLIENAAGTALVLLDAGLTLNIRL